MITAIYPTELEMRERCVNNLKAQFKLSFVPENNRERALMSMLEDAKEEIAGLKADNWLLYTASETNHGE